MSTRLQEGRTVVWVDHQEPAQRAATQAPHVLSTGAQLPSPSLRKRPVNQSRNIGMSLRAERCVPSSHL